MRVAVRLAGAMTAMLSSNFGFCLGARASGSMLAVLLAAGLVSLAPPPAEAQESSDALFRQGVALREAGDLDGAIERFRRAYATDGDARTGYNLAAALAEDGQLVEARGLARRVLAHEPDLLIADAARELVASITPRIATVSVSVEGTSAGQRLVVDGQRAALTDGMREVSLDPGDHRLEVQGPDGTVLARRELEVQGGERRDVVLRPLPDASESEIDAAAFTTTPVDDTADDETWMWVGIGGGIAAAVVLTVVLAVVLGAPSNTTIDGDLEDVRVRGRD